MTAHFHRPRPAARSLRRPLSVAAGCCLLAAAAVYLDTARAQDYPARPVRLIVPAAPGGGLDIMARTLGNELSKTWAHPIVVDNRPGAGILVGTEMASKATPDGYTLLIVNSNLGPNIVLHKKHDVAARLTGLAKLADLPTALVVNPSLPAKSVSELIALAKKQQLTYSSTGHGTTSNLCGEMLKLATKIDITHVPFRGGNPAMTAIMGGQVSMGFASLASARAQVASGKLRILAIASQQRSRLAPDVPTISETVPGLSLDTWVGMTAPKGTPAPILARVNAEITKLLASPEVSGRLLKLGYDLTPGSPAAMDRLMNSDIEKYGRVVREANIKVY